VFTKLIHSPYLQSIRVSDQSSSIVGNSQVSSQGKATLTCIFAGFGQNDYTKESLIRIFPASLRLEALKA
jgi:hypothetical protein